VRWRVDSPPAQAKSDACAVPPTGEGWLFDLKDGYCAKPNGGWRLSRGFCESTKSQSALATSSLTAAIARPSGCSGVEGTLPEYGPHSLAAPVFSPAFAAFSESALVNAESCHDWRSWESVLGPLLESKDDSSWARWIPFERYMVRRSRLATVARALADQVIFIRSNTSSTPWSPSPSPLLARTLPSPSPGRPTLRPDVRLPCRPRPMVALPIHPSSGHARSCSSYVDLLAPRDRTQTIRADHSRARPNSKAAGSGIRELLRVRGASQTIC